MLTLKLVPLAEDYVAGIYNVNKVDGRMPARARFLAPEAAAGFAQIQPWAVVSDMFRSPESSLRAVREGRGAQRPGYSAHNFGLAIDLDLEASMARLSKLTGEKVKKHDLDEAMAAAGWYCHRLDHLMMFEAWHYNYLGPNQPKGTRSSDEIARTIWETYGNDMQPDAKEAQALLAKLRLYHGEIDGILGKISSEATRAFQRTWGLPVTGTLDNLTRRTLAYVACERELILEKAA